MMRRKEFLRLLKDELRKRRDIEIEEVIFYYDELIQDAVDNGENEEVFIINLGSIKEIVKRITEDEEFLVEVKTSNEKVIKNVLGLSVKIIGYFLMAVISFTIAVTGISIFISGLSIIFAIIVRVFYVEQIDLYGYLANVGLILIGASLSIFSVALIKWHFNRLKPALMSLFRKTNNIIKRRG